MISMDHPSTSFTTAQRIRSIRNPESIHSRPPRACRGRSVVFHGIRGAMPRERWMAMASSGAASMTAKSVKLNKGIEQRLKQAQRASMLLKQVSDPTRLQVILMLSEGEKHVAALSGELNQSQPGVSHHLALLRHGSIIAPRREGKNNYYGLTETGQDLAAIVKGLLD